MACACLGRALNRHRASAKLALSSQTEGAMNIQFILQLLINGLLLGAFYTTMALGFSTIWGVMRLINLAHGEFLMMGAYVAWFFFNPQREQNLMLSTDNGLNTLLVMALIA